MQNTKDLIRAGAILLPKLELPEDLLSDEVVAREWNHPAFFEPVVRLETVNMLIGVDLEMELLGFMAPLDLGVVGKRLRRKLGFPGWALINQPQHAKYALAVVKELRKAARKIKSKPGAGKEMLDSIGLQLAAKVPQFLPSFFEEAARIFLSFENYTYGAQYFEKARNAERVYALQVDEELREQSFVDFALARALSIKSLTNFGREMIDKGEAEEGYHSYFRIAVRRTRGGLPPSPTMAKDLKKLAKAAGLDFFEEEKNFIRAQLESPALRMASEGFWKAYKKAISTLAKEDASIRSLILDLFPKLHPRKWFEILDAANATDALFDGSTTPEAKSKFTTADWFSKILKQQNDLGWWRKGDDTAEGVFSLLTQCAARLIEDGLPIVLPTDRLGVDPDVVELGLSLGLEFTPLTDVVFTSLQSIGEYEKNEGRGRDWVYISQSATYRALAFKCLENSTYRMNEWIELIPSRPHLKGIVGDWLEGHIEKAEGKGGLIDSQAIVTQFTNFPSLLWTEFPEHLDRFLKTNFALQLRKTLEIGILDEFCWPDLDAVLLNFPDPEESYLVSGFYPYLVVYNEMKFYVLGPDGICLEGEIPKHPEYPLDEIIYSQDTVLMVFKKHWGDWKVQWLGGEVFKTEGVPNYRKQSLILPDGRVMFDGHRIITPGDQDFKYNSAKSTKVVSDGERFWKGLDPYEGRKKYVKYDPLSSKKIPNEDVPFLVDGDQHFLGDMRKLARIEPESPLKTKDGVFGARWERKQEKSADDYYPICYDFLADDPIERRATMTCFLHLPGAKTPRVFCESYNGFSLENTDGVMSVNDARRFHKGGFVYFNLYFFAYFRPRDKATSIALRNLSVEQCEALMESGGSEKALIKKTSEMFPGADKKLVRGIAGIVSLAVEQKEDLGKFNKGLTDTSKLVYKDDPGNFKVALEGFVGFGYPDCRVLSRLEDLSLRMLSKKGFVGYPGPNADWLDCIGQSGAIAMRYANEVDPEIKDTLHMFLNAMSQSAFLGKQLGELKAFDVPRVYDEPKPWRKESHGAELQFSDTGVIYSQEKKWSNFVGFEIATDGKFLKVTSSHSRPGWGTSSELETFFALCESRGTLPVQEILEGFCEACGLTEIEGWLALTNWSRDVRGKAKVTVVKNAKDVFEIQKKSEIEFFSALFGSGPIEELWDPERFKERAVQTWLDGIAKLALVSEVTTLAFKKIAKETNAFVLREISNPAISVSLNKDRKWSWEEEYKGSGEGFSDPIPYVEALDFALHEMPQGSPMIANYGKTWKAIRERASHKDYLFKIFRTWEAKTPEYKKLIDLLKINPELNKANVGGFKVAEKDGVFCSFEGYTAHCYMHARILENDSPLLSLFGAYHEGGASNLEFIFSDFVDELIEHSERADIPDGQYHCNPKYCVPELVGEVTKRYGVGEDAAILYLQILSLPYPTDASVRKWNGWKKTQHDKAIRVLLEKELVLEAKRARAGRKIFIPGFWEVHKARLPTEAWKFVQLEWVDDDGEWLPYRPFPSCVLSAPRMLFEDAWKRVRDGDGPKFGATL